MEADLLSPIPVARVYRGEAAETISSIPDLSHGGKYLVAATPVRAVENNATVLSTTWGANTPVGPARLRSSIADRIPFTSPRNQPHRNLPRSNVESIQRAKLLLTLRGERASGLPFRRDERKEERTQSERMHSQQTEADRSLTGHNRASLVEAGTSPLKAAASDSAANTAATTAPAERTQDSSPSAAASPAASAANSSPSATSNLVSEAESDRKSTKRPAQSSDLPRKQPHYVHDSLDSDSDNMDAPEDPTMMPMPTVESENLTQVGKIFRVENADYVTPDRFTAPVARSPETSQRGRVADINEATTPLKNQQNGIPEPTINLLLSPNSKPIFSRDYINKIQTNHRHELEELEHESNNQKEQILRLSEELSSTNREFLRYDQLLHELRLRNKKSAQNEEMLAVQLQHYERELLATTKALKKHQELGVRTAEELTKVNEQLADEKEILARALEEQIHIRNRVEALSAELAGVQNDKSRLEKAHVELQTAKQTLDVELEQIKTELAAANRRLDEANGAIASKHEELATVEAARVKLASSCEAYKQENELLTSSIAQLTKENAEFQQINTEQQEHLERVESLAHSEVEKLELMVAVKQQELQERETRFGSTKTAMENAHKTAIEEKERLLLESGEALTKARAEAEQATTKATAVERELAAKVGALEAAKSELQAQISELEATNKHKDAMIGDDTRKMNELTQKLKQVKEKVAQLEKENDAAHEAEIQHLRREMELQLEQNRQRTAKKIDEVAELLYTQYSKKHETKVGMMRTSFNSKMDKLADENRRQQLEIESLRKQRDAAVAEKDQLLEMDGARRLLPKRTRR